jgi:hypothetical protein
MSCQRCGSDRIVMIHGKTSDQFQMVYKDMERNDYVPSNLFFGQNNFGDYMTIHFCAECGQIQSKFPISDVKLKAAING